MRNLILILLLILFFACIYLIMSRIDRLLNLLRKENLRMEKQRPEPRPADTGKEGHFRLISRSIRSMIRVSGGLSHDNTRFHSS